jgi:hypothetical protein
MESDSALRFCFVAFSRREVVSTSLEIALDVDAMEVVRPGLS